MAANFNEEFVQIGNTKLHMLKGGSGDPLLLLHGAGGNRGCLSYVRALSEQYTVYLPTHPGFGLSDRPEWIQNIHDLACFYTWFQEELDIERIRCIGFSTGGWLAAEMAAISRHSFSRLMLVDAVGIKPKKGEIKDIFIITPEELAGLSFYDTSQTPEYDAIYNSSPTPEDRNLTERDREMAVRICWKPYMHSPRLPHMLGRVSIPTAIIWGKEDQLVPLECGELYQQVISGSTLTIIENCGHSPQIEKPDEFVDTALRFLR